mgnify:CR=1 FL=1
MPMLCVQDERGHATNSRRQERTQRRRYKRQARDAHNYGGAPDHAILSVSTSCVATTSSAARDECAIAMTAIFDELAKKRVPQENVKTTNFRIFEKTVWRDGGSERIGFEVSNSLSVRLDDFGIISELLDRLVTVAGDTIRINGFRYGADR